MGPADETLLDLWHSRRDAEAFALMVSRHSSMVYATCRAILGNVTEAEDVAQECFFDLARDGAKVRRSVGGWLHALATHRSLNRLRADRRRQRREALYADSATETAGADRAEMLSLINEAIASLPELYRTPLVIHYLQGHNYDAVSEELGIPRSTAAHRVRRGVELVRSVLKKSGVIVPAATVASLLAIQAAEAAPASLTAALGSVAVAGGLATMRAAPTAAPAPHVVRALFGTKTAVITLAIAAIAVIGTFALWPPRSVPPPPMTAELESKGATPQNPIRSASSVKPNYGLRSGIAASAPPEASTPRTTERGRGSIEGFVRDESNSGGVAEAVVNLKRMKIAKGRPPIAAEPHESVPTTAEGRFAFHGLPYGEYLLTVFRPGYLRAFDVTLTPDQPYQAPNLRLYPAGALGGVVRDTQGRPIAEATVYPHFRQGEPMLFQDTRALELAAKTGADGHFSLAHLQRGLWRLRVTAPGYAPAYSDFISTGSSAAELFMTPGGSVSGRVVDQSGNAIKSIGVVLDPVEEAGLCPFAGRPTFHAWATTDAPGASRRIARAVTDDDGRFRLDNLAPMPYAIFIDDETRIAHDGVQTVTVREGVESSGVLITTAEGAVVSGFVLDAQSGAGVPGAEIKICDGTAVTAYKLIMADADGAFRAAGLLPGRYTVARGRAPGYADASQDDAKSVSLESGKSNEIMTFAASRGPLIDGLVTDANQSPVEGAQIEVFDRGFGATAVSFHTGRFDIVSPGPSSDVYLHVRKLGYGYRELGPMSLPPEGLHDLVLTMDPESVVDGKVVDPSGQPVAGVGLMATPEASHRFSPAQYHSGPRGDFSLKELPAGSYRIALAAPNSCAYNVNDDSPRVQLAPGDHVKRLRIIYGSRNGSAIEGHVTDTQGRPLANVLVEIRDGPGKARACTTVAGTYRLDTAGNGPVTVAASHPDFNSTERECFLPHPGNADFTLTRRGRIEGRVVDDATSAPVSDFSVAAYPGDIDAMNPEQASQLAPVHDVNGAFQLVRMQSGACTLVVRESGHATAFLPVNVPQAGLGAAATVRLRPGRKAYGSVVDAGDKPVADALIYVGDVTQDAIATPRGAAAHTSADGAFHLDTLSAKDTQITVVCSGYVSALVPLEFSGCEIRPIRVALEMGATIEGIVTADGRPSSTADVSLTYPNAAHPGRSAKTGPDGSFRITGLQPGSAVVTVSTLPAESSPLVTRHAVSAPLLLQSGQTTATNLDASWGDATVEGTVSTEGPTRALKVLATIRIGENRTAQAVTMVAADGRYRLENLPAGHLELTLQTQPELETSEHQRRYSLTTQEGQTLWQDFSR